ncbi:sulfurtransferase TusA family protein [Aquibaculum arenosum]|uniref:Sulfurtransferase TusA family protein n=1 Tax=Aquibaculum arenosum TaxID=3032591 RepID=A0ABT5YIT4_9PROT|nr:sulfurtransferase TusA family protein [Fodinicurvata sp. CAU 1616]MDF2094799.1 sulfurtransferase TusA family protein [Fodinicurvata sp. CAU 1616]
MDAEVTEIDTRGLRCPLPVLRARKAIAALPDGARLRVLATDPDSRQDFRAWCETSGHELLEQSENGEGILVHLIRKVG